MLSCLPKSWSKNVTVVNSLSGQKKLKLQKIYDLILSEDIHKRELGESSSAALSTEGRGEK